MTSIDSGVDTGNDSNDSSQVENQSNQIINKLFELNDKQVQLIPSTNNITNQDVSESSESNFNYAVVPSISAITTPKFTYLSNIRFHPEFVPKPNNYLERKADYPSFRSLKVHQKSFLMHKYKYRLKSYAGVAHERKMRIAAATNNIELMNIFLQNGVSPNNQDQQGRSPLHLASCRGYTEMVQLLLNYGANPNQRDCLGNTPLHLAAVASKISVVTLLLKAGTDVLSSDQHGYNPLQLAQTKLKMLQNCKGSDMNRIKEEVHKVVDMLLIYLNKQKDVSDQIETLTSFCSRISLSNTSDQVQDDVKDLLANIQSLDLSN